MQYEMGNLVDLFQQKYWLRFADTESLRQSSFRLRHDVYCNEKGWERTSDSGLEVDCHDLHATHCLIQHRETGEFVGTVRLVERVNSKGLPCERHLKQHGQGLVDSERLFAINSGELSRLAISADHRGGQGLGSGDHREGGNNVLILAGLVLAVLAIADLKSLDCLLMLGEPRVRRVMKKYGLATEPISGHIELNGIRRLHCLRMHQFNAHFSPELLEFYRWIKGFLAGVVPGRPVSINTAADYQVIRVFKN